MSNEVSERVVRLETKVENHDRQLQAQLERNELLTRMSVIIENQREDALEREKRQNIRDDIQTSQMEMFSSTLKSVNDNLTNLNSTQQQMKDDLGEIGNRVEKVEKKQKETTDKNTIDLTGMSKRAILWTVTLVSTVVVGAVVLYIQIKVGLK